MSGVPACLSRGLPGGETLPAGVVTATCSRQALQQHYHPEVSQAASVINQALSVPEVSIAPLLELTAFEVRAQRGQQRGAGHRALRVPERLSVCLSAPCRSSSGT